MAAGICLHDQSLQSASSNGPSMGHDERLLRFPEVQSRVPYSRTTLYRLISCGEFPAPVKMGARANAWPSSVIDSWIQGKIKGKSTNSPGEAA